jgi:hypothetical protein
MKLFTDKLGYQETIEMANELSGSYNEPVIFHCFWNGKLNQKHYFSILSCFYTNVLKRPNRKIILWTNTIQEKNEMFDSLSTFCEVRWFNLEFELATTNLPKTLSSGYENYTYKSDRIRYIVIYKFGGVWFDLDIFFLKSLDPVLSKFKNEICVYTWSNSKHPNGAIFISNKSVSNNMFNFLEYLSEFNNGFGFQDYSGNGKNLEFDSPVDLTVLPCSWFDGSWCSDFPDFTEISNKTFFHYTEKDVKLDTFAKGAFCYHWHNLWDYPIQEGSYFDRLAKDLLSKFNKS